MKYEGPNSYQSKDMANEKQTDKRTNGIKNNCLNQKLVLANRQRDRQT